MRSPRTVLAFILVLQCVAPLLPAQEPGGQGNSPSRHWWNSPYIRPPAKDPNAAKLSLISVRGNAFVDARGDTMLFRGVSIADPDKIEGQGHWNKELFVRIRRMGARLVRIPVHPIAWRERTPRGYMTLLDSAVSWCTDLGLYVIIDWHSIGNVFTGLYQSPMYTTSREETFNFWSMMSRHFQGNHTTAFFELFNEPTLDFERYGPLSWDEWKRFNEELIVVIRAYDKEKIPLVAGFDWAYDLTPLRYAPIAAEGIGYVAHPYPQKRSRPWEPKWDVDFGFAAARYPVIATEIGFGSGRASQQADSGYGKAIVTFLEGRGISWLAWVYDPEWMPSLISSWDTYSLTPSGEFFKQAMEEKAAGNK